MNTQLIDARDLEPPEPMERVMASLPALDEAAIDRVRLLLYREPFPLYQILRQNGYHWHTELADDGTYQIDITPGRTVS